MWLESSRFIGTGFFPFIAFDPANKIARLLVPHSLALPVHRIVFEASFHGLKVLLAAAKRLIPGDFYSRPEQQLPRNRI